MKTCPKCESDDLADCWSMGRLLRFECRECGWKASPRIPEQQEIRTSKLVNVDQFGGFTYELFDKYGHTMILSQTFYSEDATIKSLKEELKRGRTDKVAGPYTVVLWPAQVEVQGKKFT